MQRRAGTYNSVHVHALLFSRRLFSQRKQENDDKKEVTASDASKPLKATKRDLKLTKQKVIIIVLVFWECH